MSSPFKGKNYTMLAEQYHISFELQGVREKLCFFHNLLQTLLRLYRCKRPSKLSTQCECTVTPIG